MKYDYLNPREQIVVKLDARVVALDNRPNSVVCVRAVDRKGRGANVWLTIEEHRGRLSAIMTTAPRSASNTHDSRTLRQWIDHDGDERRETAQGANYGPTAPPAARLDGGRVTVSLDAAAAHLLAVTMAKRAKRDLALADSNPGDHAAEVVRDVADLYSTIASAIVKAVRHG